MRFFAARRTATALCVAVAWVVLFAHAANAADVRNFACHGFEPNWLLNVTGGNTTFHQQDSSPVTRPNVSLSFSSGQWTLVTQHPLTAVFVPSNAPTCPFTGNEFSYAYTVTVTLGSQTLRGCCNQRP